MRFAALLVLAPLVTAGCNVHSKNPANGDENVMLRWMFWEQYNHEPNVATLRFWKDHIGHANLTEAQKHQIPAKREAGDAALKLMDKYLEARDWFVASHM